MREKLSKQWRFQLLSITLNVNAWNIMFTVCVINRTLSLIGLEAMNSIGRQACWKAWAADADCLSVPGCLILAADIRYPGQAKAKSESKLMKASWKRFHTHKHTLITLLLVAVFFVWNYAAFFLLKSDLWKWWKLHIFWLRRMHSCVQPAKSRSFRFTKYLGSHIWAVS